VRRETAIVAGFVVVVAGSAALVWSFALPNLVPLHVPKFVSVAMVSGPSRQQTILTPQQVSDLNKWIDGTTHEWGPLSSTPPSSGDAVLTLHPEHGADYTMTVWLGISAGDWNDAAVLQRGEGSKARYATLPEHDFAPLRHIVQPEQFQQADAP
jgi:hypothetical protein